jgi:hypothetical protein
MAKSRPCIEDSKKATAAEREARWRTVVAEWSKSGLSQAAFCGERALPVKRFYWWRSELARRERACKRRPGPPAVPPQRGSGGPQLVPLRVVPSRSGCGGEGQEGAGEWPAGVEVLLAHGRRVRVGRGFEAEVLAAVVSVLEHLAW